MDKKAFLETKNKAITLIGMSGVGKTWLSDKLSDAGWFHYSADYRIGSHYLGEAMLQAAPEGIAPDGRHIKTDIQINDIRALSDFLGMVGDLKRGGLPVFEFRRRQDLYIQAEVDAMLELPDYMDAARQRGAEHFVCDSSGSLCEVDHEGVFETLSQHTLFVYLKASEATAKKLFDRALSYPKPLYYPEALFKECYEAFCAQNQIHHNHEIDPKAFFDFAFPILFQKRLPKYQALADQYGVTIDTDALSGVKTGSDFISLIEEMCA